MRGRKCWKQCAGLVAVIRRFLCFPCCWWMRSLFPNQSTVFTWEFVPATSGRLRGAMFSKSLVQRADSEEFPEPLWDKVLLCCCSDRLSCHGNSFTELSDVCACTRVPRHFFPAHVPSDCGTHVAEFCSDVDCELVPVDGVLLETFKSSVISRSISNAPEWTELTFAIRGLSGPSMWDIFAGSGTYVSAFESAGWIVAPAVDTAICPAIDVLSHLFFAVILGLVLEGRFVFILLGRPCAPFTWSDVSLGNAFAETSIRIAKAQSATKQFWQTEQPGSSFMWLPEMLSLESSEWKAVRHVCMDGAPWMKHSIYPVMVGITTLVGRGHQQRVHIGVVLQMQLFNVGFAVSQMSRL